MKIIPNSDILIDGKHSPAGVVCETSDIIGKALVAQGLAKIAPVVVEAPAPVIETAEAAPVAETAAAQRPVRTRRTAAPAAE